MQFAASLQQGKNLHSFWYGFSISLRQSLYIFASQVLTSLIIRQKGTEELLNQFSHFHCHLVHFTLMWDLLLALQELAEHRLIPDHNGHVQGGPAMEQRTAAMSETLQTLAPATNVPLEN